MHISCTRALHALTPETTINSVGGHSRNLAQARLLPLGDTVVVERAVSQNTLPVLGPPTIWSLFGLWLPRRAGKSKHSPRSSISIALTTARIPMPSDQRPGWTRTSVRAASVCSSLKTGRGSSVLRSRRMFQLLVAARPLLADQRPVRPPDAPTARSRSRPPRLGPSGCDRIERAAAGRADGGRQRPRSPSLRRQRLRPDQGLPLTDAAARPGTSLGPTGYPMRRAAQGHSRTLAQASGTTRTRSREPVPHRAE